MRLDELNEPYTYAQRNKKGNIHQRIRATYLSRHENDGKCIKIVGKMVAKRFDKGRKREMMREVEIRLEKRKIREEGKQLKYEGERSISF